LPKPTSGEHARRTRPTAEPTSGSF
jgi:hypothetical protein